MDKKFCIFDMDGTLVDSMPIWKSLGKDYLEARGHRPTQAQLAAMGPMTMLEGAAFLMETFGVAGPPERIIEEMHAVMEGHYRTDIPLKPGVRDYGGGGQDQARRVSGGRPPPGERPGGDRRL